MVSFFSNTDRIICSCGSRNASYPQYRFNMDLLSVKARVSYLNVGQETLLPPNFFLPFESVITKLSDTIVAI